MVQCYGCDVFLNETDVVDLYVDKKKRVWILDFDTFASSTDPLLFSWEELLEQETPPQGAADDAAAAGGQEEERDVIDCNVQFRVIQGPGDVFPHTAGTSRGPIDVTAVSDPVALMMKLTQSQQQDSSSHISSDENDVDDTTA
jgi:hypothetical protein